MADSFQSDVWDLRVSTRSVIDASSAWLGLKAGLESTADQLAGSVSSVREVWDTPMATSYFEHVPGLIEALRIAAGVCGEVSTTLDDMVTDVMGAQSALSVSFHRLRQQMLAIDLGGTIIFLPQDDADHELLAEETASARRIRRQARGAVGAAEAVVRGASTRVAGLRSPWSTIASTGAPHWDAPIGTWVATSTMLDLGGSTLITGTSADDVITVGVDPATGETIVTVGDVVYRVPRGQPVVINAGDGNDRITVPTGTTVHLRFLGGAGDDRIDGGASLGPNDYFGGQGKDSIEAGAGNDFLSGGADRDYLDGRGGDDRLFGGHGNDVVYGMGGDDVLDGGAGNDYLEGAEGDDQVSGGDGADQVSGGRGDDTLLGGGGDDVMLAGDGTDVVHGQDGVDTLYVGADDTSTTGARIIVEYQPTAGEHIEVSGSPEFVARVQADLEMLRSSPVGQHALETLGQQYEDSDGWWPLDSKAGLKIVETDEPNAWAHPEGNEYNEDGYAIQYNPSFVASGSSTEWVPVVVLYHEMGHIFQFGDGSWPDGQYNQAPPGEAPRMVNNGERQNVGLPWNSDGVDPDEVQPDPLITENALRRELGVPERQEY